MILERVRANPRYKVALLVLLSRHGTTSGIFWIKAHTLSEGDIEAVMPIPLGPGEIVLLDLMLPEQILSLPARVDYQTGNLHRLEFIDIAEEQRAEIRHYCQAYGSKDPDSSES